MVKESDRNRSLMSKASAVVLAAIFGVTMLGLDSAFADDTAAAGESTATEESTTAQDSTASSETQTDSTSSTEAKSKTDVSSGSSTISTESLKQQKAAAAREKDAAIRKAVRRARAARPRVHRTTKSVLLKWSRPSGLSVKLTGYKVYRRKAGQKKYHLIAKTSSRKYRDKTLRQGKKYFYRVRGYRKLSSYSNGRVVTTKISPARKTMLKLSRAYKNKRYAQGLARYIGKVNGGISYSKRYHMAKYFVYYGKRYNVMPSMLAAIAQHESTFRVNAVGGGGAYLGLMQCNASLGRRYANCGRSGLLTARKNIKTGAAYLGALRKMCGGSYYRALTHYCGGSGPVASRISTNKKIRSYLKRHNYIYIRI